MAAEALLYLLFYPSLGQQMAGFSLQWMTEPGISFFNVCTVAGVLSCV